MAIEKDAEKILEEFSKTLDKVPELEGTLISIGAV